MSFILDALKKSELERQRQSIPGLVDSGVIVPRPRLPIWAIALGGLLAINLLVLVFVLARGWLQSAPAPATARTPPVATAPVQRSTPPAAAPRNFSPMDSQPTYAPEIPVAPAPEVAAAAATPKSDTSGGSSQRAFRHADPVLSEPAPKSIDYPADNDEVLPTISEISLSGTQKLPELHLDVHVYSTRAADRFVYVNMRKYHEGSTLQEGPTVEHIRRDGVVLNYQGVRFLLPRQ